MSRYLLRRLLIAFVLVFVVSSLSVVLTRLAPGDYVTGDRVLEGTNASAEQARARLGLNRSIGAQYLAWLGQAVRFDFGQSFMYNRPVSALVPERARNTMLLGLAALVTATVLGIPLGVVTAWRPDAWLSRVIQALSLVLLSAPPLLTSLLLVFIAARTGWLPVGGMQSSAATGFSLLDLLRHMVVPVLALALPIAAMLERLHSQATRETLAQPFVQATAARGVSDGRMRWRNTLKPALRPVFTIYGVVIGSLLSGSFAVEMVTAWPGLGRLMFDALRSRDVYLVAGCTIAGSLFLSLATVAADAALATVDPRVRER